MDFTVTVNDLLKYKVKFTPYKNYGGSEVYHFEGIISGEDFPLLCDKASRERYVSNYMSTYGFNMKELRYSEVYTNPSVLFQELQPSDFRVRIFGEVNSKDPNTVLESWQLKWQADCGDAIMRAWNRLTDRLIVHECDLKDVPFEVCTVDSLKSVTSELGMWAWYFEPKDLLRLQVYNAAGIHITGAGVTVYATDSFSADLDDNIRFTFFLRRSATGIRTAKPDVFTGTFYKDTGIYYIVKQNLD